MISNPYEEVQAAREFLHKQVRLSGDNTLLKTVKRDTGFCMGLSLTQSIRYVTMLQGVRSEIKRSRKDNKEVPLSPMLLLRKKAESAAYFAYDKTRPSANVSVEISFKKCFWGVDQDSHNPKKINLCVSPAWHHSSASLHTAFDNLPFFIFHSQRVGREQADGLQYWRIDSVRYLSSKVVYDTPDYMATLLGGDMPAWGRGDTILNARTACHRMMTKQVKARLTSG